MEKVKNFFNKKVNLVSTIIFVILLLVIIFVFFKSIFNGDNKFSLNPIYDVYPEEVRNLYSNMVEVSCYGDLHFDISLDTGEFDLKDVKYNNLIDYIFSYLDKEDKLDDEILVNEFEDASNKLFAYDMDFTTFINNYTYGDYVYTLNNDIITRKNGICNSEVQYISQLYGYSYNDKILSVDVNIGYLKDNILYNLTDENLGEYDGDIRKLGDMFQMSSYYRFNYILDDEDYKLKSIEWNIKY